MTASPPVAPPAVHPESEDAADLETLALWLARGAADVVRAGRADPFAVDSKSTATDLVTEVDRASESWLVARLAELRPGDGVLGEEGAGHDGGSTGARVRWVVDPIDGTVNFVLGLPEYAVSVAAEVAGTVVAGAVCNPVSGDTFHARRGGGAVLLRAGQPPRTLSGPRAVPLERAIVGTGFGYDAAMRARQVAVVAELLPRIADIRRIGSAALDLCRVAAGTLDAYFEAGLNPWDHAAGALVATEAGCRVTGPGGGEPTMQLVAAAGPDLSAELVRVLGELGADRVC
ncbi:inositol monophosphatase family protein [uncultured Jatrophihabitans sp.]|uniref:inositol monophosphatase family protein n=1 Tax=uncultured Jatrophihabitans sp. TaxID=1610747 RepID=UPI0035CB2643